jgi:hypothetical protein
MSKILPSITKVSSIRIGLLNYIASSPFEFIEIILAVSSVVVFN